MAIMIRVGISGWRYAGWRGVFYPKGLVQRKELAYAAERLNSIEINGSFYALQRPDSYRLWRAETADDFVFTVKGGRFITHMKKLSGVETALANFFASGVLALGAKLGPFLWQLPPNLGFNTDRMASFLDLLPRTAGEVARMATGHDAKIPPDRALTAAEDDQQPIRHAVEVRHESFRSPDFFDLLRQQQVALVVADTAGKWPYLEESTADFQYVRLHGDAELYASGYSDAGLDHWAAKVRAWSEAGQDVFVYFDNDMKVHAPYDAIQLLQRLGVGPAVQDSPPAQ
ncbi:MAG: DUF72 domain-containing protein [Propionibacteriaceae bacterium]|nr:DUF72 domain-containing protein [Propionibacteriaceae bacterium]